MNETIRAILFDSGRVLNQSATGHWFIPPNFFKIINSTVYQRVTDIKKEAAFAQATEILADYPLIKTKEEEYNLFVEYYRVLFSCMRSLKAGEEQITQAAHDLVYNPEKYTFFPEALEVIPELSRTYKLGIVSDAWPSLEDVYTHAGLRGYFSTFILSSVIGVRKPDLRMFEAALNDLGLTPLEVVFVDDLRRNCDGARRMGMRTILLCRDGAEYYFHRLTCRSHRVIRSLKELPALLTAWQAKSD